MTSEPGGSGAGSTDVSQVIGTTGDPVYLANQALAHRLTQAERELDELRAALEAAQNERDAWKESAVNDAAFCADLARALAQSRATEAELRAKVAEYENIMRDIHEARWRSYWDAWRKLAALDAAEQPARVEGEG